MTHHPVKIYRHRTELTLCYILMWKVRLEFTIAHFHVLGLTRQIHPSLIKLPHQKQTQLYCCHGSIQWEARKLIVQVESWNWAFQSITLSSWSHVPLHSLIHSLLTPGLYDQRLKDVWPFIAWYGLPARTVYYFIRWSCPIFLLWISAMILSNINILNVHLVQFLFPMWFCWQCRYRNMYF